MAITLVLLGHFVVFGRPSQTESALFRKTAFAGAPYVAKPKLLPALENVVVNNSAIENYFLLATNHLPNALRKVVGIVTITSEGDQGFKSFFRYQDSSVFRNIRMLPNMHS